MSFYHLTFIFSQCTFNLSCLVLCLFLHDLPCLSVCLVKVCNAPHPPLSLPWTPVQMPCLVWKVHRVAYAKNPFFWNWTRKSPLQRFFIIILLRTSIYVYLLWRNFLIAEPIRFSFTVELFIDLYLRVRMTNSRSYSIITKLPNVWLRNLFMEVINVYGSKLHFFI